MLLLLTLDIFCCCIRTTYAVFRYITNKTDTNMAAFHKEKCSSNLITITIFIISTVFLLGTEFNTFNAVAVTQTSSSSNGEKSSKSRASLNPSASKQCPFFDGIYTSVMRRIFYQGFHKYGCFYCQTHKYLPPKQKN